MAEHFKDYLAEQMKDPEFAAAYTSISAEEDARLAEIQKRQDSNTPQAADSVDIVEEKNNE